jgi:hypothetical protein
MINYFAYGSNMNPSRMVERNIQCLSSCKAYINNSQLLFNKKSWKDPSIGFANIAYKKDSIVEGTLYVIDNITLLDKWEGYPKHYMRIEMDVIVDNLVIVSYVYIANPQMISEGLKPRLDYVEHLLKGEWLSDSYKESIKTFL